MAVIGAKGFLFSENNRTCGPHIQPESYILLKYFADCASNLHQDHSDKESHRGK